MILEKRSVLFILHFILHFLRAFGDNDDSFAIEHSLITMLAGSMGNTVTHDPGSMANLTSEDFKSVSYESTASFYTTDSPLENSTGTDASSTSSNTVQTTRFISTSPPRDTTPTDDTMTCDPATWPINASAHTREVFNLTVDSKSMEWISLSWEPPCADANISVAYSIERYDGENFKTNRTNATWYNATNLDPCTQYTFAVRVLTESWTSEGSNVTATTDDTIGDIGDKLDLKYNASVNVIELVWKAPLVHEKCVSNYSVVQCNGTSPCSMVIVSATNYTAKDLEPCTEYNFTVQTMASTVRSASVNARTTSLKLSVPRLNVTPGNFSLSTEWEPPQIGAACLKYYHVNVQPNNFTFNTTDTNLTILRLHACMTYQIFLSAVNENNEEGDAITEDSETLPYETNPPQAESSQSTNSSVSIFWSINKENSHCLLEDIVTTCNCTENNRMGYKCVNNVSYTKVHSINATIITEITTVMNLSPFSNYTCWAFTISSGGKSNYSDFVNVTTSQDVPSEPIVLPVRNNEDSWFLLNWEAPKYLPGILEDFEIMMEWTPLYPVPSWCTIQESIQLVYPNETYSYNYTEAKAFTNYTVSIRAKTGAGWGEFSKPQTFRTKDGVPEAITKMLPPIIKPSSKNANVLDTILTWGSPCALNGELEGYKVSVHGIRENYDNHSFSGLHACTDSLSNGSNDSMCSINLYELKGEYNYTIEISAKVRQVDTCGPSESQVLLYPAGIPPQPTNNYIQNISIDPYKLPRSTTTATVLLPFFCNTNGDIKYYAVMVAMANYNKASSARFDLNASDTWPHTSAWKEAMTNDFTLAYQATQKKWNPHPNQIADYGELRVIKYTVGEDISCKDISSRNDKPMYCNGPLKPDTWYHVRMRAFTNGGYTDSEVFLIKTSSELNVTLVIGGVFGILVVGILVTMMLLVRKCSPYVVLRRFLHSDMPGSPVPAPFTRKKFISHCQQLIDNPGKLSNEFRLLQTLSVDLQMPTNTACLQANRKKNRYSDILPYDFSRVKLEVIDNDPNTDYINASFIRGYTGEDEYIACQGPKEETTYDFWRMVDQYNINIIVMLTQLVEKGKEKCHQYYPTIRETFRYENMTIRCTSELDYRTHTQRTLVLQKENKKRNIIHLHFKDWPDHDVPEDFDAMINFCQIIRRNISANKGFVVVHCSAGIGRTGTLITIDILLQHLRDNRKLDVFGTVYRLRHHRINMVQRESQYAYIYNCIKQVLKNPYFLKTYKPPPVDPVYDKAGISKNTKNTVNSDVSLVSNLEILKKYSASIESSGSIGNFSSRSTISTTARRQKSAIIRGLRHYKSMGVINVKTRHISLGRSRTLDCVFYKSLSGSSSELSRESVTQESLPLLICSRSAGVLGDSVQSADGQHVKET